jgi:hypothetical protein
MNVHVSKRLLSVGVAAWTIALASHADAASNLVVNGDFSLGDTGFQSQYYDVTGTGFATGFGTAPNFNVWNESTYAIGANADLFHNLWDNVPAPSGAGNYMIVNGASDSSTSALLSPSLPLTVWGQTVAVVPNTLYEFSAQATTVTNSSPAVLDFYAGSTLLGALTVNGTPAWDTFSANWFSGSNTSVVLKIIDANAVSVGNDFGLDNITLSDPAVPESSTWGMMLTGFAGLAFAGYRAKRRTAALPA